MIKNQLFTIVIVLMMILLAGCGRQPAEQPVDQLAEQSIEQFEEQSAEQPEIIINNHSSYIIEDVCETEPGRYICSYDGVKHDFIIDFPVNAEHAPLIIMLHGYGESAESFRIKTGFEKDATALGYAVVYVTGAPSPEDATSASGWNSGIALSGNKDVDFLCGLVNYLCDTYNLDSSHVFAVGFSNGAFMTHRLAMEADDTFTGIVSVAGMMPESVWENKVGGNISVFQITGEKDDVVPKNSDGSAKYAKAPAIEDVMDYYVENNGLTLMENETVGKKSTLTKYGADGTNTKVWNLFIPDGRHSWPDENITGININQIILQWCQTVIE